MRYTTAGFSGVIALFSIGRDAVNFSFSDLKACRDCNVLLNSRFEVCRWCSLNISRILSIAENLLFEMSSLYL
jgi:hypothetical protein